MDAWRQYLYRIVVTLLTEARAMAAAARMRRNTLTYNDLLFKSATLLRERADVRRALQTKIGGSSWTSSRTRTRSRQRSCSCSQPRRPSAQLESAASAAGVAGHEPLDWRSVALRRARSSWSAIRSNQFIASAAPTSRSTTWCVPESSSPPTAPSFR